MDGSVMHMFYNEFIYIYIKFIFSTNSYAFSFCFLCMCMARNYNNSLLNGSFFVCNKVIIALFIIVIQLTCRLSYFWLHLQVQL